MKLAIIILFVCFNFIVYDCIFIIFEFESNKSFKDEILTFLESKNTYNVGKQNWRIVKQVLCIIFKCLCFQLSTHFTALFTIKFHYNFFRKILESKFARHCSSDHFGKSSKSEHLLIVSLQELY